VRLQRYAIDIQDISVAYVKFQDITQKYFQVIWGSDGKEGLACHPNRRAAIDTQVTLSQSTEQVIV